METIINYKENDYKLPKEGWFKLCYYCSIVTSKYIIVNEKYKYYYCLSCQKKKKYNYLVLGYYDFDVITYFDIN